MPIARIHACIYASLCVKQLRPDIYRFFFNCSTRTTPHTNVNFQFDAPLLLPRPTEPPALYGAPSIGGRNGRRRGGRQGRRRRGRRLRRRRKVARKTAEAVAAEASVEEPFLLAL